MNENIILELIDGTKYAIVDQIIVENKTYCLVGIVDNEMNINSNLEIKIYNDNDNILEDVEVTEDINEIFNERLKKKEIELEILKNINVDDLVELKIKDIKEHIYYVEYNNEIKELYLEFYTNTKPLVNDKIYIDKNLLNECLLSYGYIKNLDNINNEDILILVHNNTKIYFRRYYG